MCTRNTDFVNFLHEMDEKVDQFVFVHELSVCCGDQKTDVEAGHRFAPQNDEIVRALAHKLKRHKFGKWKKLTAAETAQLHFIRPHNTPAPVLNP